MRKATYLFLLSLVFFIDTLYGQCLTAPPVPPACNGSEPLITNNETLNSGTSKWFYGAPAVLNSFTMNGGVLTVCSDLTIDRFYMDSGTINVRPGVRFIIGSGIGAGLVFEGNCVINNYGYCEIQRNLSFGNANASAARPNIVINAQHDAVFRMANQYLVVNSPHSYFVNNGTAEFWGIITDAMASPGSICLGQSSTTRMSVLINKVADSYVVPTGNACVYVNQFSQFNNRLTDDHYLFVCLGSGHSSYSGCGGCPANNWGSAQVFTGCVSCLALGVLPIRFQDIIATNHGKEIKLSWKLETPVSNGYFRILRSSNGTNFTVIDSFAINNQALTTSFNRTDRAPLAGDNFYMINFVQSQPELNIQSSKVKITAIKENEIITYPVPFEQKFFVSYPAGSNPRQIILTDISGKNLAIRYTIRPDSQLAEIFVSENLSPGIYILHVKTDKQQIARTILKK